MTTYNPGKGASLQQGVDDRIHREADAVVGEHGLDGAWNDNRIRAIYKTVDQIKTKYGQVRPQDRARLNNRVEQKLIECREMANLEDTKNLDNDYND